MDQELLTKIIEETDIVALASEFMSLTKKGKNYMGLCPFHDEKTPSFSVSPEKHIAKCMGCGKGGNTVTFYSQIKNISFRDASLELAERLGIEVKGESATKDPNEKLYLLMEDASRFYQFALKNSKAGESAYSYLQERGMTDDDIEHFEIGLAPSQSDALYQMLKSKSYTVTDMMNLGLVKQSSEGDYYDVFRSRITFPVKNDKNRIVGFSARSLLKDEVVKYVNSTETKIFKKGELLYHFTDSLRAAVKQKYVILHEGFFDVIASYKSNLKAAVATMGTALTADQAKLIKRISDHVVVAYDGDAAGRLATLKAIPVLRNASLKISVLALPKKLDPDEYVKKHGVQAYYKLYEDELMDPYLFGYGIYQEKKDFSRADDITLFKKEMRSLLSNADETILAFYQKKALDELGIELFLTRGTYQLPVKERLVAKPIVSKAERAIDLMLINLLKNNTYLGKIQKHLDLTKMVTKLQKDLYKEIINYYAMNQDQNMDIEKFKLGYTKNQEQLSKYVDAIEFKKDMLIKSDKEFNELIDSVVAYGILLEVNDLIYKIGNTKDQDVIDIHLKKIEALRKRGKVE